MIKRYWKKLLIGLISLLFLPLLWQWWINWTYHRYIFKPAELPTERVAIVFGARIYADGGLSQMLADRVETAVQLYQADKVQKLIMSGDNRFDYYDEPGQMMEYAMKRGVPRQDIQPDYGGRRTYDTCYRAKEIFQLKSVVLVTQDFHLPRALFTCRGLGIEATGVSADLRTYYWRSLWWSKIREVPATMMALVDVIREEPAPVLGEKIKIE